MHLAAGVPVIETDRVQTQQAILNLIMNSVEAMRAIGDGTRRAALLISTRKAEQCGALLEVGDSDPGLALAPIEHLFAALDTTKSGGLGLGLSICPRSSRRMAADYGHGRMSHTARSFTSCSRQPGH
jgi:C4-dicarboxylate-specific signal transduction histidine kinase